MTHYLVLPRCVEPTPPPPPHMHILIESLFSLVNNNLDVKTTPECWPCCFTIPYESLEAQLLLGELGSSQQAKMG